jgi:retron-type reverse transcriptase
MNSSARLAHRLPELGVGGVGLAVQQVVADRAVQQEVSWVIMPIARAGFPG